MNRHNDYKNQAYAKRKNAPIIDGKLEDLPKGIAQIPEEHVIHMETLYARKNITRKTLGDYMMDRFRAAGIDVKRGDLEHYLTAIEQKHKLNQKR